MSSISNSSSSSAFLVNHQHPLSSAGALGADVGWLANACAQFESERERLETQVEQIAKNVESLKAIYASRFTILNTQIKELKTLYGTLLAESSGLTKESKKLMAHIKKEEAILSRPVIPASSPPMPALLKASTFINTCLHVPGSLAHPPIHPLVAAFPSSLEGTEARVRVQQAVCILRCKGLVSTIYTLANRHAAQVTLYNEQASAYSGSEKKKIACVGKWLKRITELNNEVHVLRETVKGLKQEKEDVKKRKKVSTDLKDQVSSASAAAAAVAAEQAATLSPFLKEGELPLPSREDSAGLFSDASSNSTSSAAASPPSSLVEAAHAASFAASFFLEEDELPLPSLDDPVDPPSATSSSSSPSPASSEASQSPAALFPPCQADPVREVEEVREPPLIDPSESLGLLTTENQNPEGGSSFFIPRSRLTFIESLPVSPEEGETPLAIPSSPSSVSAAGAAAVEPLGERVRVLQPLKRKQAPRKGGQPSLKRLKAVLVPESTLSDATAH